MSNSLASKAQTFWQLHQRDDCFIMPNAWDAGSAFLLAEAGFEALGTTSAGIAYSRALADGCAALDFDSAVAATRQIVDAVAVGISMDSENLYAETPQQVHENMKTIVASGVVGASIEDYSGDPAKPYYDIEVAVERVAAARAALDDLDYPFVLTARSECYLYGHDDAFGESLKRINRYRAAGADCLYVPGLRDLETIRKLVQAADAPINVVMGLSGAPLSFEQLRDAGVRRISVGGSLARAALGLVRDAAHEMRHNGSFGFAERQIADGELCQLFAQTAPDD